jgi:hypothetical protein
VARKCLHPNAALGVCNSLISSHTVQRSRVLRELIGQDHHVLTFHPSYAARDFEGPFRVGWRRASTISGFCGRHDTQAFGLLENRDFTVSWEQCFLLGYRALCHEIYEKSEVVDHYEITRRFVDRGHSPEDQLAAQEMLKWHHLGARKGLEDLRPVKDAFDRVLLSGDLKDCRVAAIEFAGPLCLATAGTMTPDVDLGGNRLQVLHDAGKAVEWLSVAIDVTTGGGAVVFCWLAAAASAERFVQSLLAQTGTNLVNVLPQIVFYYLGNTYFSASWWEDLAAAQKAHMGALAMESNPYYGKRAFVDERLTSWTVQGIRTYNFT